MERLIQTYATMFVGIIGWILLFWSPYEIKGRKYVLKRLLWLAAYMAFLTL